MNIFSLTKTVAAPMRFVYDWCTDFDSVQLKVPTAPRRIVESTKSRAIYIELYDGPDGQQRMGVDIITLKPPRSWRMEYFGEDNDEIGEYSLKSLEKNRTRIDMHFRNKWKGTMALSTEEKRRIESDVWDKYTRTLERDFLKKNG